MGIGAPFLCGVCTASFLPLPELLAVRFAGHQLAVVLPTEEACPAARPQPQVGEAAALGWEGSLFCSPRYNSVVLILGAGEAAKLSFQPSR